nr:sodium:potassium:calcium exchanger 6 [Hymenolepis microstoma]
MHQKSGSANAACASSTSRSLSPFSHIRRKRLRSLQTVFPILLLGVVLVASAHVGIATATSPFTDFTRGPQRGPDSGDAPNSSVCRHALQQVPGHSAKCDIARDFQGCRFDSGFISYLEFLYCQFSSPVAPTILMVLWLFTLLGAFAVIADSFFSPSLIALARSMHMSQNLAGVTLLAFGNGAPDVFSAVTAITTGNPEAPDEGLGLGFLMGSGLLVNTVTAGLIMIIRPFATNRRPFIKDVIFYMSAVIWSAAILIRRSIDLKDSIGFIMLYILYVITTWAASHVRLKKSNTQIYRRCANYLKDFKNKLICKRRHLSSREGGAVENENRSSFKISWWARFRSLLRSRRADIDTIDVEDPESRSKRSTEKKSEEIDVKIIGFRRKPDPMSISKRTSHNGGNLRTSLQCFPRIEVTGPPTDGITSGRSSTLTKSPSPLPGPTKVTLAPPKDPHVSSLLPSQHPHHSLTPQPQGTPPICVSRRASAIGGSHSMTAGSSSFRKRSVVGGIGLRSRTPSIYQRRGSRRMSTMDQLPFVVRWIIANEENDEHRENSAIPSYGYDESTRDPSLKRNLDMRHRYRNISDATQAGEISDFHTYSHDVSLSRSPAVSFIDDPSSRGFLPDQHRHSHPTKQGLQRISSVSLPDLGDLDQNSHDVNYNVSADSDSRLSLGSKNLDREMEVRIFDKVEEKVVKADAERSLNEEEDCEDPKYADPFIKWAKKGMWHHLIYTLCPVDISEWHELSIPVKFIQIIQAPIFLLFSLTIPVVYEDLEPSHQLARDSEIQMFGDENEEVVISDAIISTFSGDTESAGDAGVSHNHTSQVTTEINDDSRSYIDLSSVDIEDLHGWCRLLNCFQCLITPMLWVLLITVGGMPLGLYKVGNSNLPVVVIVLLISSSLAITIFVTSRWDRAPVPYHRPFFAILGFLTSIVWIYAIAHELVNSLEALGIVWEISEAILGITVMAFANSISDLMSNSLLAHNGYPRIAFAACIGSPLFNLLVGAGASYTIKLARSGDHNAAMSFTLTHALLFSFLMGVLMMNLIVAFATGFQMRRSYGIVLLTTYAIFMVLAILVEADVIVPPKEWNLLTGTE